MGVFLFSVKRWVSFSFFSFSVILPGGTLLINLGNYPLVGPRELERDEIALVAGGFLAVVAGGVLFCLWVPKRRPPC